MFFAFVFLSEAGKIRFPSQPSIRWRAGIGYTGLRLPGGKPDRQPTGTCFVLAWVPRPNCRVEVEDFFWLGESLRNLGVPLFSLLEGGYSRDLPELIFAYLQGLAGK